MGRNPTLSLNENMLTIKLLYKERHFRLLRECQHSTANPHPQNRILIRISGGLGIKTWSWSHLIQLTLSTQDRRKLGLGTKYWNSSKINHRTGAVVCPLPMNSLGQSKLEALFPGGESKWRMQREAVVDSASHNLDSLSSLYCSFFFSLLI